MNETAFLPETIELAKSVMLGQIRDLFLDYLKDAQQLPWNLRTESEQRTIIDFVERRIADATAQAVQIIAEDGKRSIIAEVEQISVKDGLKAVLKATASEANILLLSGAVRKLVLITATDAADYAGRQARGPEALQAEMFDGDPGPDDDKPVFDGTPNGGKRD